MSITLPQACQIDQLIRHLVQGTLTVEQFSQHLLGNDWTAPKLQSQYHYSEAIQIYDEVMQLLQNKQNHLSHEEMYQYAFEYIQSQEKRIVDEESKYQRSEINNQQSLQAYLQQLLNHYARLLFVRIDFAIKQEFQAEISLEQFQTYLKTLSNRYSNQDGCFSGLQGYAWAIEEGIDKGLHCHTLLIYDGNKHQNDFGRGLQVAQVWDDLTQGKGSCFISNAPEYKQQFAERGTLGIGMIHRNNPQEVQNALSTAMYLVNPEKELQHLRVRIPRMRTFGTGLFVVKKRRGINHSSP